MELISISCSCIQTRAFVEYHENNEGIETMFWYKVTCDAAIQNNIKNSCYFIR